MSERKLFATFKVDYEPPQKYIVSVNNKTV